MKDKGRKMYREGQNIPLCKYYILPIKTNLHRPTFPSTEFRRYHRSQSMFQMILQLCGLQVFCDLIIPSRDRQGVLKSQYALILHTLFYLWTFYVYVYVYLYVYLCLCMCQENRGGREEELVRAIVRFSSKFTSLVLNFSLQNQKASRSFFSPLLQVAIILV